MTHEHRSQEQIQDLSIIEALAPAEAIWREAAISFFRSWIEMVAIEINPASNKGLNTGKHEYFYDNISVDDSTFVMGVSAHVGCKRYMRYATAQRLVAHRHVDSQMRIVLIGIAYRRLCTCLRGAEVLQATQTPARNDATPMRGDRVNVREGYHSE